MATSASYDIDEALPLKSCGCGCGGCGAGGPQEMGVVEGVVRAANGTVVLHETDISLGSFGFHLGITRSYWSRFGSDVGLGPDWSIEELPRLVEDAPNALVMIESGSNETLYFTENSDGSYSPKFFILDQLELDGSASEFVLTNPKGEQKVFSSADGRLLRYVDAFGHEVEVDYDSLGRPERIACEPGGLSGPRVEYAFAHGADGIETVTLYVDGEETRKADYGYDGGLLSTVTVSDKSGVFSGWKVVRQSYYRYDGSGRLEYVLGDQACKQAASAGSGWPEAATDGELADYADYRFTYNASGRVGALATTGGQYGYSFAYFDSAFADGANNWKRKTVVTMPGASIHHTYYFNHAAGMMLREVSDGSETWRLCQQFDAAMRLVRQAPNSAVASVSEASAGLVTLETNTGPVGNFGYTAQGYLQHENVRRGSGGTDVRLRTTNYLSRTARGVTLYFPEEEIVYRGESPSGSDPSSTEFAYLWWSSGGAPTFQMQRRTTALPVVSAGENGDGSTQTTEEHFDEEGFVTETADTRGVRTTYEYDRPTGAMTRRVEDAGDDSSSRDYLNATTDYEVDNLGRTVLKLLPAHEISLGGVATEIRTARWTYYKDDVDQRWEISGFIEQDSAATEHTVNPVMIAVTGVDDGSGARRDEAIAAEYTAGGIPSPSHSFARGSYLRWSTTHYDQGGQLTHSRVYHTIPGSGTGAPGTNYDQTEYGYDALGRRDEETTPGGTILRTALNAMGWPTVSRIGTETSESAGNMTDISENLYEGAAGEDGMVTTVIEHVSDAGSTEESQREVYYGYDWRDRLETARRDSLTQTLITRTIHDNRNIVVGEERYHTAVSSGNLFSDRDLLHDSRGRLYSERTYAVGPAGSASVDRVLTGDYFYDGDGRLIRQVHAGSNAGVTVTQYDALGRAILSATGYEDGSSVDDPGDLGDVVVMEQSETAYDDAGNTLSITGRVRFDNATGVGPLGTPTSAEPKARVSHLASYPDGVGRIVAMANYGTNGASAWSRPAVIPAGSATVLLTATAYDAAGQVSTLTDPMDTATRYLYDDAGRKIETIENDGGGSSSSASDRVTRYEYNADGNLTKLIAENADTGEQVTEWVYGVSPATGSELHSGLLVFRKIHPNSVTRKYTYSYNRQGQVISYTDQNLTTHELAYDGMGRLTDDDVTALGSGVDGAVRRLGVAYSQEGLAAELTSYNGSDGVVNQVQRAYNDFLQLQSEKQSHSGAVGGSTPVIAYEYADGTSNTARLEKTTYPGGDVVRTGYDSTAADKLSRADQIGRGATPDIVASYRYLGLGGVVGIEYGTSTAVEFTYEESGGGDGGDKYVGLDRFGRVTGNVWKTSSTDLVDTRYGYDAAGNPLWRQDAVAGSANDQDNFCEYDNLYQLTAWQRGELNGGKTGMSATTSQKDYDHDETGNWKAFAVSVSSPSFSQTREHNAANEITEIDNPSGVEGVEYDENGNTTACPTPASWTTQYVLKWDAWNRPVEVQNTDSGFTWQYAYDAAFRRVTKKLVASPSQVRHFYYDDAWRIVEERVDNSTDPDTVYVWGVRNINDLILRERYSQSPDEVTYALTDIMNIAAYTDDAGAVVQRIVYDGFGNATFLTPAWGASNNTTYGQSILFHGHYLDNDTGLYQMRFRYYHPQLGRWLSRDMIANPNYNLFVFNSNNPSINIDFLGLAQVASTPQLPGPQPNRVACASSDITGSVLIEMKFVLWKRAAEIALKSGKIYIKDLLGNTQWILLPGSLGEIPEGDTFPTTPKEKIWTLPISGAASANIKGDFVGGILATPIRRKWSFRFSGGFDATATDKEGNKLDAVVLNWSASATLKFSKTVGKRINSASGTASASGSVSHNYKAGMEYGCTEAIEQKGPLGRYKLFDWIGGQHLEPSIDLNLVFDFYRDPPGQSSGENTGIEPSSSRGTRIAGVVSPVSMWMPRWF